MGASPASSKWRNRPMLHRAGFLLPAMLGWARARPKR
jgi:hypothetical protein